MIINALTSIAVGIMSVFQIELYITPKDRRVSILMVLLLIPILWCFLCDYSEPYRPLISVLSPFIFLPIVLLGYEGKLFCKLHNLFVQLAAISSSLLFARAINPVISPYLPDSLNKYIVQIIILICVMIWTGSMWYLRSHGLKVEPYEEITYFQGFVQSVIAYACAIFCSFAIDEYGEPILVSNPALIIAIFCIVMVAYTIAIFTINRTLLIKHKTQGFISAQRDDFRRELERQRHNQMSARILKHDIDNYINSVKKLIEEGEYNRANKILDDLSDRNKVIAPEIFSEDTLINSILVEYSQRADIANVKFQCECRISEPIAINDLDLSAVLFNGLDNALESSEKIEDPDKRMIDVNIFTSMGYLIVRIKNTYDARPIIKNNHIASTKIRPGESHGNGLFSMDLIAKKYFGKKNIYVEGQFVALYVILKNISLPES
ncbi:MAG: GHKL domain-containing protein [Firmicutes bacterium]|nr:GHKL domain-containing protein [Bacillota bacterium]